VLNDYKEAQILLGRKYPDTVFIHGTFPLTHSKITLKTRIKQIFKSNAIWEFSQNIYTNKYNTLIRENYGGEKAFFDFEKIQSTYPNGQRSYFVHKGEKYFHMVPDYTYDRTHLNEEGKRIATEAFLLFLSSLIEK